ncbi:MAG TPA: hypothetical protein VMM59_12330, partial [Thermohalobaculum sp.]|nr:hypothetical protein [Thermohalobaculum sp.]
MKIREHLRWRPASAGVFIVLWILWELVGQPIWNLNVERLAEQREIDGALRDNLPSIGGITVPSVVIEWVDYLTGPFLTGFVIAAAIFGLGPSIAVAIQSGA